MDSSGVPRSLEMMAEKHLDFRRALADPRSEFGAPERLLADPRLDREGKRAILRIWEQDERELAVAEEEGMSGGERSMLRRVILALDAIADRGADRVATPTKHGGPAADVEQHDAGPKTTQRVKDLMRPIHEVVHMDQDLRDAYVRMRDFRVPFLPVVDGDEIVGILTARDIYAGTRAEVSKSQEIKVRDRLSREIAFCYESDDLETALAVVDASGQRRLLVTDEERHLVGFITLDWIAASLRKHGAKRAPGTKPEVRDRLAKASSRAEGNRPGSIGVYAVRPKIKK